MSRSNSRPPKRMGHGPMMGATEKAKNFKGTMRQLIAYMRPYYVKISLAMLFAVAGTIFMIVGPKILGKSNRCRRY